MNCGLIVATFSVLSKRQVNGLSGSDSAKKITVAAEVPIDFLGDIALRRPVPFIREVW